MHALAMGLAVVYHFPQPSCLTHIKPNYSGAGRAKVHFAVKESSSGMADCIGWEAMGLYIFNQRFLHFHCKTLFSVVYNIAKCKPFGLKFPIGCMPLTKLFWKISAKTFHLKTIFILQCFLKSHLCLWKALAPWCWEAGNCNVPGGWLLYQICHLLFFWKSA